MVHLLFNAKRMKRRTAMTGKTVARDIRRLKYRIKLYADSGDDYIDVSARDTEWRTRYYWMQYFLDRGFSITKSGANNSRPEYIVIGW